MFTNTAVFLSMALAASAHVVMQSPTPINVNPDLSAPMSAEMFPCNMQGGASAVSALLASAKAESWEAGSSQSFSFGSEGAFHNGGSCQASISEDGGKTFKVVKSYIGDCPVAGGSYDFVVPAETKAGPALFAWTWFNKVGNREMYMNCAAIDIQGGGSGLSDKPDIFVANLKGINDCTTVESENADFSDPACVYSGGNNSGGGEETGGSETPADPETPAPKPTTTAAVEAPAATTAPDAPVVDAPVVDTPVTPAPAGGDGQYVPDQNGWKRSLRRHARDVRM